MMLCPFRSWGRLRTSPCDEGCKFHDGESGCGIVPPGLRGRYCPMGDKGRCAPKMCAFADMGCAIAGESKGNKSRKKRDE